MKKYTIRKTVGKIYSFIIHEAWVEDKEILLVEVDKNEFVEMEELLKQFSFDYFDAP